MCHALIFSDLHLGAQQSTVTAEKVIEIIEAHNPETIVFDGDTLDFFVSVAEAYRRFAPLRRYLARCPKKIVVLQGNHDKEFSKIQNYAFEVAGKRFNIFHGHQVSTTGPFLTQLQKISSKLNDIFLRVFKINFQDIGRKLFARKYPEGKFLPAFYKERAKVLNILEMSELDVLITGHTHYHEITGFSSGKIYANCGRWDHYICIGENAEITLNKMEIIC